MLIKNDGAIEELLKVLTDDGFTAKQILEAAKQLYKEHAEGTKDSHMPRVRCSTAFRKLTEEAALKVDKSITEYIYDAVEDSNSRLGGKE